jgi:hypothetical protein
MLKKINLPEATRERKKMPKNRTKLDIVVLLLEKIQERKYISSK